MEKILKVVIPLALVIGLAEAFFLVPIVPVTVPVMCGSPNGPTCFLIMYDHGYASPSYVWLGYGVLYLPFSHEFSCLAFHTHRVNFMWSFNIASHVCP